MNYFIYINDWITHAVIILNIPLCIMLSWIVFSFMSRLPKPVRWRGWLLQAGMAGMATSFIFTGVFHVYYELPPAPWVLALRVSAWVTGMALYSREFGIARQFKLVIECVIETLARFVNFILDIRHWPARLHARAKYGVHCFHERIQRAREEL